VVIAVAPFQFFLAALAGWLTRQPQDVIAYLVEEHRVLRVLRGRRPRLTDDQRRRLGERGHRLGCEALR
jgi:hypothetical protein